MIRSGIDKSTQRGVYAFTEHRKAEIRAEVRRKRRRGLLLFAAAVVVCLLILNEVTK